MRKILVVLALLVSACSGPVAKTGEAYAGKIVEAQCYSSNWSGARLAVKTSTGYQINVFSVYTTCPAVRVGADIYIAYYSNGDCWVWTEGQSQRCR